MVIKMMKERTQKFTITPPVTYTEKEGFLMKWKYWESLAGYESWSAKEEIFSDDIGKLKQHATDWLVKRYSGYGCTFVVSLKETKEKKGRKGNLKKMILMFTINEIPKMI